MIHCAYQIKLISHLGAFTEKKENSSLFLLYAVININPQKVKIFFSSSKAVYRLDFPVS